MLGGLAALMVVAFGASSAWAEPSTYCVKATKVLTPKKHFTGGFNDKGCTSVNGTHEGKFEKIKPSSFTEAEEQELKALLKSEVKALLKYTKVEESGVGGKPTVQFSGANVQVVNGLGVTAFTNGEGNLVVGYDENPGTERGKPGVQTGSHNLILGEEQEFTSYGGLLAGFKNTVTTPDGSVSGGNGNTASAAYASVSGGSANTASGFESSISGGGGGKASGIVASISGGVENVASGVHASVSGGQLNKATADNSSIFGSKHLETTIEFEAIP
jgi:hypothetical protein